MSFKSLILREGYQTQAGRNTWPLLPAPHSICSESCQESLSSTGYRRDGLPCPQGQVTWQLMWTGFRRSTEIPCPALLGLASELRRGASGRGGLAQGVSLMFSAAL